MYFSTSTLAFFLAAAVGTQATNIHNSFGHDLTIQDDAGTNLPLKNGAFVTLGGEWSFVMLDDKVCKDVGSTKNSVVMTWLDWFDDVSIKWDGWMHDSTNRRIGNNSLCMN